MIVFKSYSKFGDDYTLIAVKVASINLKLQKNLDHKIYNSNIIKYTSLVDWMINFMINK